MHSFIIYLYNIYGTPQSAVKLIGSKEEKNNKKKITFYGIIMIYLGREQYNL
jgi:hypothetical protein